MQYLILHKQLQEELIVGYFCNQLLCCLGVIPNDAFKDLKLTNLQKAWRVGVRRSS